MHRRINNNRETSVLTEGCGCWDIEEATMKVNVNIATETAVFQAGAHLRELYYLISEKSKVHGFPAIVGPTVGVGGHLTCGGYGTMPRKYGLSFDQVIDTWIVDVKGRILDTKSMGEALFWPYEAARRRRQFWCYYILHREISPDAGG
ncbi:hypothetical protein L2E82_10459 [Cichorium intybus]|uniref:Uncharacterized protein n=1 Tax=Cichorium intybus TaxID=13427 RepID=A0ACB9GB95_CICIN|nr:hypothetical protein L2E82_10459 [Cichorium intybus]